MSDKKIAVKVDHVSKFFKLPTKQLKVCAQVYWSIGLRESKRL